MNSAIIIVVGLTTLLASLCVVEGDFTKIDDMTDRELQNWIKPPNKQTVQRMLIDRILKVMDARYNPCDDFYKYSCGNYEKIAPTGYPSPSPFSEILEQTSRILKVILTNPGRGYSSSRVERIVRDLFDSCMHGQWQASSIEDVMESFGSWPAFDPYWRENDFDWMKTFADLAYYDVETLFHIEYGYSDNGRNQIEIFSALFNVSLEENNPVRPIDDYIKDYQKFFANIRVPAQYLEGMVRRVHSFKSKLYKITQDSLKSFRYNVRGIPIYDVQRRVPSCDLGRLVALIAGQEVDTSKHVGLPSAQYMEDICRLLRNTDKQTIADYFFVALFDVVRVDVLTYKGQEPTTITTFCVEKAKKLAGPILGKMFIDEYLTAEVMNGLANISNTVLDFAVEMMRTHTTWLDARTRQHAVKKMEAPIKLLVAPEYSRSEDQLLKRYADVSIDSRNFLHNQKQLKRRNFLNKYGVHGKSRHYYEINPLELELAFAGDARGFMMIQAIAHQLPLYHPYAPSFFKFGVMLAILGHEYMHGFDINNIIFDENGQEQPWVSPQVALTYISRAECFYTQFENYKLAKTDIHVGGFLTLGENVVDNDGLKIAFNLYKKWMAENPEIVRQEEIDYAPLQLTHEQLFFLSYGQTWCDTRSFEYLVDQIATDTHSPAMFRVIGGVSNSHDFAKAYQCPPNFKMNPSNKCNYFFD